MGILSKKKEAIGLIKSMSSNRNERVDALATREETFGRASSLKMKKGGYKRTERVENFLYARNNQDRNARRELGDARSGL